MKTIKLSLTIDEANIVLEGLGNLPFKQVARLVYKVQETAQRQLAANDEGEAQIEPQSEAPVELPAHEAAAEAASMAAIGA